MDKHKCKFCFKSFANGRALGGHMRSHMMNLSLSRHEEVSVRTVQLSFEAESASSSSSSESDDDDEKGYYGLRENPKRSLRLVDPEFSLAEGSSVILQDRESENESSKNNPTRKRSKRTGQINNYYHHYGFNHTNTVKNSHEEKKKNKTDLWVEHELGRSSISNGTTEEAVAFCLMMLSRDKWKRQRDQPRFHHEMMEPEYQYEEEEEEDEEEEDEAFEESDESSQEDTMKTSKNRVRGRYKCDTCNKVFRSYQALGGHRASHKKIKLNSRINGNGVGEEEQIEHGNKKGVVEKKIHECPVCFRVFASGQALGGHKRTHVTGSTVASSSKLANSFIDLNLPAPIEEDDVSQIENSAVSDAEFVKTH
ncbi:hypothetical protein VNO78_16182 [Psophocarpus tetragonolobus]|uniref:C2H2-type domain-containing protein n=1 Tax=Psophocarpus tetragonolobus TaxID=3891 RepID=A0AAN9SKT0_PSOTE